jgi:hypothetical protein
MEHNCQPSYNIAWKVCNQKPSMLSERYRTEFDPYTATRDKIDAEILQETLRNVISPAAGPVTSYKVISISFMKPKHKSQSLAVHWYEVR